MMTAFYVPLDDKEQRNDVIRRANEYTFQLRDQEAYVSLLVDDSLANWLSETFIPAQSAMSTLFVRELRSGHGRRREVGAAIDQYRDVLAELKRRFRDELQHVRP